MSTLNRTFDVKNGISVANTVVLDNSRNLGNLASVNATSYYTSAGLDVTLQANTARNTANAAYGQANAAYSQANTAYGQANSAYGQANSAYSAANSAANTVRVSANGGSTLSGKQLNFVNTATALITVSDAADGNANITVDVIGGGAIGQAYAQANAAYGQANAAYGAANTANTNALNAYAQANAAYGQANSAYSKANAAYSTANLKIETINGLGAIDISSGSTNNVVTYSINVNRANITTVGVTKLIDSVTSTDTANAATANAVKWTYDFANTMLPKSGGTISGDLTVSGNLYLSENTTLINVSTLNVSDPLIYLAANNDISDSVDIGFVGGKNTSGTYSHTGLVRHASDGKYYLFDNYHEEPTNNVIDVTNTDMATLRANLEANSILLVGNVVATQANLTLAHNQANTARTTANDAYAQANAARNQANTAYGQANDAFSQANAAYGQANAAYGQANAAYGAANTANTNALNAYAQANTGATNAVNAYGQANAAYGQANAAYNLANTKVSKSGDTMTGTLTITTSGTGLSTGNASVNYLLTVGSLNVTTNTVTTIASGQVVLDTFPATDLASAKYFVQAKSGSDYHTTEIVLVQDATNVWISEYGSIYTAAPLGTFSADINSGSVRLLFNATNAVNTVRSVRYGIAT